MAKKLKFSNLSKPLIYYRIHKESITQVHSNDKDNRDKVLVKIYNNYFQTHGINLTSNELQTYRNFIDLSIKMDNNYELIEISKVLKKITENVCKNDDLDFKYFEHMVSKYIRLNFEKSNYNFFEINKLITENFKSFIRFDLFNNLLLLKRKVIK